jgi:hypothetical protein
MKELVNTKEKEIKDACEFKSLIEIRDELERLMENYDNNDAIVEAYREAIEIVDAAKARCIDNLDDRGWNRTVDRLPNEKERKRSSDGVFGSQFIVLIEKADIPTSLFLTDDGKWTDGRFDPKTGTLTEYQVALWREFPILPKFKYPF